MTSNAKAGVTLSIELCIEGDEPGYCARWSVQFIKTLYFNDAPRGPQLDIPIYNSHPSQVRAQVSELMRTNHLAIGEMERMPIDLRPAKRSESVEMTKKHRGKKMAGVMAGHKHHISGLPPSIVGMVNV